MVLGAAATAKSVEAAVWRVGTVRAGFGEGALWSARDDGWWWVDMARRTVAFTRPDGATEQVELPTAASGVAVRASGGVVAAAGRALVALDRPGGSVSALPISFNLPDDHVFNDVAVDPAGRMLVGSIRRGGEDSLGVLVRVAPGGAPEVILRGFRRTNGLAFSPDGARLYVSDSHPDVRSVWRADYYAGTGAVGDLALFTDFAGVPGRPDGGAVDSEGCYWSAAIDSGHVHRFAPDGQLERSVALPTAAPTKPAFGGQDLRTLFVTTANRQRDDAGDGVAGALFAFDAPAPGCAVPPTAI